MQRLPRLHNFAATTRQEKEIARAVRFRMLPAVE